MVVDQYAINQRWETKIKPHVRVLVSIDDFMHKAHHCDILLNQNVIEDNSGEIVNVKKNGPLFLKGPAYCLLDHHFRLKRRNAANINFKKRIFVYFGGSDPFDLTNKVIDYAISLSDENLIFDIVLPRNSPLQGEVELKAKKHSFIQLHSDLTSLATIMGQAAFAIGSAGVNSWERICVELPSINVITAENQKHIAQQQEKFGLARNLGEAAKLRELDLHRALDELINGQIKLNERHFQELKLDGFGAFRVATAIRFVFNGCVHIYNEIRNPASLKLEKQLMEPPINKSYNFYFEIGVGELLCTARFIEARHKNSFVYSIEENRITLNDDAKGKVLVSSLNKFWEINKNGFVSLSPIFLVSKNKPKNIKTVAILSDQDSWINPHIEKLITELLELGYSVNWGHKDDAKISGDVRFLLSFSKLLNDESLEKFKYNLLVHESDLPKGKGWSPMSWQIRNGESKIIFSLIFAEKLVDSGNIIAQRPFILNGSELSEDWRSIQGQISRELCLKFINEYPSILNHQKKQSGESSFFEKLTPFDSELKLRRTIDEQFNVLRTVDNKRYPAYFFKDGQKYLIKITKEKV